MYSVIICKDSWTNIWISFYLILNMRKLGENWHNILTFIYIVTELSIVKHISLSLDVDFEKKILIGVATLNIDVLQEINEVVSVFWKITKQETALVIYWFTPESWF